MAATSPRTSASSQVSSKDAGSSSSSVAQSRARFGRTSTTQQLHPVSWADFTFLGCASRLWSIAAVSSPRRGHAPCLHEGVAVHNARPLDGLPHQSVVQSRRSARPAHRISTVHRRASQARHAGGGQGAHRFDSRGLTEAALNLHTSRGTGLLRAQRCRGTLRRGWPGSPTEWSRLSSAARRAGEGQQGRQGEKGRARKAIGKEYQGTYVGNAAGWAARGPIAPLAMSAGRRG